MKKLIVFVFSIPFIVLSQNDINTQNEDTLQADSFLEIIENSLFEYYKETLGKEYAYAIIDSLGYQENDKPYVSDSVIIERLNKLNANTIIEIQVNQDVINTVRYFINKRRNFTAICLGRSILYFPMYEQYLDKYNMPIELKYLSVIESGLRPTVKSRAGAVGLWQFMYRTGKMMDLHTDSYVDERMHPEKATDAACRYLKYLFGLYGDWSLALASYNAGPGNVNKAIKRAGGKMNYWEVRPFLPKETQMYVPNFIAMLYMMTYHAEHNILPKDAKIYLHETDTVCVKSGIKISHLDSIVGISYDEFIFLNPVYKTDWIPETEPAQCILLPIEKIKVFIENEDSLYRYNKILDSLGLNFVMMEKKKYHYVKQGETMASIALMYDVTITNIKDWNELRSNTVYPEQRLTILVKEKRYADTSTSSNTSSSSSNTSSSNSSSTTKTTTDGKYKYYIVKSGDSLWAISQKVGVSVAQLEKLNSSINPNKLQPGQKIIIGVE